jgi:hypothetical protein
MDSTTKWLLAFFAIYAVQGILSIFYSWLAPTKDLLAAAAIVLILLIIHRMIRIPRISAILLGVSFIPHVIGLYQIIRYDNYVTTLYGAPQLYYHYDWFVHVFAMICISVAFSAMTYKYFMMGFRSKMLMFVIVLFFVLGLGSLSEIMEYVGFDSLGYGSGFLEYGEGDSSPTQGPWQNSSMDMVSNLAGALVGTGLFLLLKRDKTI